MVSPLVMHRQTVKPGDPTHPRRRQPCHAAEVRRKAFLASSQVFDGPIKALQAHELPKPAARVRPKSAEPVTRSTLHLSSGNYRLYDPHNEESLKVPFLGEVAQAKLAKVRGIPATLVASQLMQSATPPGVYTGEDAVHYFSTNKHQSSGSLFIFCNFTSADPSIHDPYSLVVVDRSAVDAEHCIISCTGVCHIRPNGEGNTVSLLHAWAAEARQFRTLRRLTFFKKFLMVKAWAYWKTEHIDGKFARRAKFLEAHHLMLNAWFGESMRTCHCLVRLSTYVAT